MMSLLGLVAFLALAWAISLRRGPFPWRTVLAGMALQLMLRRPEWFGGAVSLAGRFPKIFSAFSFKYLNEDNRQIALLFKDQTERAIAFQSMNDPELTLTIIRNGVEMNVTVALKDFQLFEQKLIER